MLQGTKRRIQHACARAEYYLAQRAEAEQAGAEYALNGGPVPTELVWQDTDYARTFWRSYRYVRDMKRGA